MAEIVVCHGAILLRSETLIGHRFAVTDKVLSFLSAGNVTSAIMQAKTRPRQGNGQGEDYGQDKDNG